MSHIIYRHRNGVIYVYEETTTRDRETGKPTSKQKLIGKVDDATGQVVPNRKYNKKSPSQKETELITTEIISPDNSSEHKKGYRTIKKARSKKDHHGKEITITSAKISALAIPTRKNFEYTLSIHPEGYAYMHPLNISTSLFRFENGEMFFNSSLEPITSSELKKLITHEGIEHIDISLLNVYFSIILRDFQNQKSLKDDKKLNPIVTIYLPELLECLGIAQNSPNTRNGNIHDIALIIAKTMSFQNIIGIIHIMRNGELFKQIYPVLNFERYDEFTNTISFSSPYFFNVINAIHQASLLRDKRGNIKLSDHNLSIALVSYSYLVKPEIYKERNKTAVENVFIIIKVIEQAGNNIPHVKASTIVNRNEFLNVKLLKDKHPSRLLDRVFKKTWQLLRKYTRLTEFYPDIQLPDPNDIRNIPTFSNLDDVVITFPHNGKTGAN